MKKFIAAIAACAALSCFAQDNWLPNSTLTPGAIRQTTLQEICTKGSSKVARLVSNEKKQQVYARYGLKYNFDGYCQSAEGCEVDHLISLELGGSNDITNLWPESYVGTWNAHMKDKLENKLHELVCSGKMDLQYAQSLIVWDWTWAYTKYVEGK